MTEKIFFFLAYVSASIKILKHKHPSEGIAATALVYVKFGVQSCLKINTCVCLSDLLCGFQQGKTEFGKIKVKSTTLPRNSIGMGRAFKVCYNYLGFKKNIYIKC